MNARRQATNDVQEGDRTVKRLPVIAVPIAIAMALALVFGVVVTRDDESKIDSAAAVHFVVDAIKGRTEGARYTGTWYRTLDEVLPNVEYRRSSGQVHTLTDLAVVGHVISVEKGRGFTIPGCVKKNGVSVGTCDAPGGTPSEFDAPNALWWSVHATIAVEQALGSTQSPEQVQVALPLDAAENFDLMAAGLKGMGRMVLFLDKGSPLVEYDPSLYVVYRDATFIATAEADGTLALPMFDDEEAAALLASTPRVRDLADKAKGPKRTIQLANQEGLETRP